VPPRLLSLMLCSCATKCFEVVIEFQNHPQRYKKVSIRYMHCKYVTVTCRRDFLSQYIDLMHNDVTMLDAREERRS
jgi:hypothetical protein